MLLEICPDTIANKENGNEKKHRQINGTDNSPEIMLRIDRAETACDSDVDIAGTGSVQEV